MIIETLDASNFRSFDEKGLCYGVKKGLNTIVGENSAGKSNIISIFSMLLNLLKKGQLFDNEDYFEGNVKFPIKLTINACLEDKDFQFLLNKLGAPLVELDDFKQVFGDKITIAISYSSSNVKLYDFQIGDIYLYKTGVSKFRRLESDFTPDTSSPKFRDFLANSASLVGRQTLKSQLESFFETQSNNKILLFDKDPTQLVMDLFDERILIFPEFRGRPSRTFTDSKASTQGNELASVLFNLKNGDYPDTKKFDKIQCKFKEIFPNLEMDVRKGNEIYVVKKSGYQIQQDHISAGLMEVLNIITHLIAFEDRVFVIDEPELHLHPHAERLLHNILKESANKNQIICVTHSTRFVDTNDIDKISIIRDVGGVSKSFTTSKSNLHRDVCERLLPKLAIMDQKDFFSPERCYLLKVIQSLEQCLYYAKDMEVTLISMAYRCGI